MFVWHLSVEISPFGNVYWQIFCLQQYIFEVKRFGNLVDSVEEIKRSADCQYNPDRQNQVLDLPENDPNRKISFYWKQQNIRNVFNNETRKTDYFCCFVLFSNIMLDALLEF